MPNHQAVAAPQRALRLATALARLQRSLCAALAGPLDLVLRIALARHLAMQAVMAVAHWPQTLSHAGVLSTALAMNPHPAAIITTTSQFLLPALLVLGLGTRFAVLPVIAGQTLAWGNPELALCLWFALRGAGALSLDHLLARGIYSSALPGAARAARALRALAALGTPALLLTMRLGVAAALLTAGPVAQICAGLLAAGLLTRLAVLPVAALAILEHMGGMASAPLPWGFVLALLAVHGGGLASLDHLIAAALQRRYRALRDGGTWPAELPHVVIIGGGFGGMAAAQGLAGAPCAVTLIDQRNFTLFQPLLYQVATASLSPADIATPIRAHFRAAPNIRVRLGTVTGIDPRAGRVVLSNDTGADDSLKYDQLIIATGARHAYFGNDAWEEFAPGLKTIEDATAIRHRLLRAFEQAEAATDSAERTACMTFVVIGAGPTGVELAGAIAELARHGLEGEFRAINPAEARVKLIHLGDRVLPTFPPELSAVADASLRALGVEVLLNASVTGVDAAGVDVLGADKSMGRIACRTAFWAAGVQASPAAAWLGVAADRAGRVPVGPDLTVAGHPDIFVVGDTAAARAWAGQPVPGLAPAAKQGGAYAASVIRARLEGRIPPPAFAYRHAGSLATIGRRSAVADFGRVKLSGAVAWWLWGAVHVVFLAGARNRLVVAVQWFWAYLTLGRGIRLITGER